MNLGQILKYVRTEKGYRQNDIAILLHIDSSTVSRFETGKEKLKDLDMLVTWSEKLGSNKPLLAACQECPIQIKLNASSNRTSNRLLN